ncbi:MAG: hypothetical protein AAGD05_01480 [Bacteroidota bacterium]
MEIWYAVYLAISWALVGLIWVIQLVHYPFFRFVDPKAFHEAHQFHTFKITLIVMPLMLGELSLAAGLAYATAFSSIELLNLILVLLIWGSTFFVQIPLHQQLEKGKQDAVIQQLVRSNWFRTFLWTAKAGMMTWFQI